MIGRSLFGPRLLLPAGAAQPGLAASRLAFAGANGAWAGLLPLPLAASALAASAWATAGLPLVPSLTLPAAGLEAAVWAKSLAPAEGTPRGASSCAVPSAAMDDVPWHPTVGGAFPGTATWSPLSGVNGQADRGEFLRTTSLCGVTLSSSESDIWVTFGGNSMIQGCQPACACHPRARACKVVGRMG